jgi:hypothetical protein
MCQPSIRFKYTVKCFLRQVFYKTITRRGFGVASICPYIPVCQNQMDQYIFLTKLNVAVCRF